MLMENLLHKALNCSVKLINNMVIGNNNVGRMLLAHSSYFEILIESNVLSQLIYVESWNISLESMQIRKNNIIKGIIYAENTVRKISNTYIENNNNFIASILFITSTYTTQKIKFSIKDFFSKYDQIQTVDLPHLLKKSVTENFNFCAVIFSE